MERALSLCFFFSLLAFFLFLFFFHFFLSISLSCFLSFWSFLSVASSLLVYLPCRLSFVSSFYIPSSTVEALPGSLSHTLPPTTPTFSTVYGQRQRAVHICCSRKWKLGIERQARRNQSLLSFAFYWYRLFFLASSFIFFSFPFIIDFYLCLFFWFSILFFIFSFLLFDSIFYHASPAAPYGSYHCAIIVPMPLDIETRRTTCTLLRDLKT